MRHMTITLPMCSIDFMDTSMSPEEQAIADRITELRQELGSRLMILGHHYQRDSIVMHADFIGDSFMLSQKQQILMLSLSYSVVSTSWPNRLTY